MKRNPALALVAALAAAGCAATENEAFEPDRALAFLAEGDTTVIEEYRRTANALVGELRPTAPGADFGVTRYRATLGAGGRVERVELTMGGGEHERTWVTVLEEDHAHETVSGAGAEGEQEWTVPPGTLPLFAPSIALLEQILLAAQARGLAGDSGVAIPVLELAGNGALDTMRVRRLGGDTLHVQFSGGDAVVVVDDKGLIREGEGAGGALRIVRLPAPSRRENR